jgi:predicted RNA-binding protein with PUA-like domain
MNYWLFKTEPGCFSLGDLRKRPGQTEHWDGVRNYQARNFLRDSIKKGDGVFFYHSGIPAPAIVGLAEVVREGYPDFTALDPESGHFDPKSSPESPIWFMVDIRFRRELPRPVALEMIRANPLLASMPLLNRSRLSVQPVTADQWRIIIAMAGVRD